MPLSPEEMFYLATGLVDADSWTSQEEDSCSSHSRRAKYHTGRRREDSSSVKQQAPKTCWSTSTSCQRSSHPSSLSSRTFWLTATTSHWLMAVLLLLALCNPIADACSSRSTPKPRPPPPPPSPSPALRPNITFQTYACPPAYAAWYCLNGATCFTVKIGESILYNCECTEGYMGQRCEFKDLDGSYLPLREKIMLERASIAGGATVAVVLVVILSIIFYTYMRQRRKEKRLGTNIVEVTVDRLERRAASARMAAVPKTGNSALHIKLVHYANCTAGYKLQPMATPRVEKKSSDLPSLTTHHS